ncbi:MAG: hypothetical protein WAO98_01425 [Alphaproteobacteria bacterium]
MNLTKNISQWGRSLRDKARRGVAATEFALTMPIWVTLLVGASDGAYALLLNERTDRIAYTVTDIVSQHQTMTVSNLNDITLTAGQMMQPFAFGTKGVVIVTSVYKPPGAAPYICWQYKGGGTLSRNSQVGTPGGAPVLPNGLTINDNDNVIISEVYYLFTPMFITDHMFPSDTIYRNAVYKPRLSPLITTPG